MFHEEANPRQMPHGKMGDRLYSFYAMVACDAVSVIVCAVLIHSSRNRLFLDSPLSLFLPCWRGTWVPLVIDSTEGATWTVAPVMTGSDFNVNLTYERTHITTPAASIQASLDPQPDNFTGYLHLYRSL